MRDLSERPKIKYKRGYGSFGRRVPKGSRQPPQREWTKLNPRQYHFVQEYMRTKDVFASYRAAGYTGSAKDASKVFNNKGVQAEIRRLQDKIINTAEKHGMTPGKVLMPLAFGSLVG